MNPPPSEITSVKFNEVPNYLNDKHHSDFQVLADPPHSPEKYCISLFQKIYSIGLSEVSAFLIYNTSLLKNPHAWLNSLEKLIKLNIVHFSNPELQHRHTKLISQIDITRHSLEQSSSRKHAKSSTDIPTKKNIPSPPLKTI